MANSKIEDINDTAIYSNDTLIYSNNDMWYKITLYW